MKLSILGATGSIGQSALAIAAAFPEHITVTALTSAHRVDILAGAITEFSPRLVSVAGEPERARLIEILRERGRRLPEILCGEAGHIAAAVETGASAVLSAIVGGAALSPTFAAVAKGLKVALANKESMVMGGDLLMPLAARTGAEILPVDSEHSAIFQALGGTLRTEGVRRLILTASGGPFRGFSQAQLANVTKEDALKHPRWSMGAKITCDSATMMNKGLEIIEAHHLFNMPYDKIDVLIHPQSIVHSIVEYVDGSQIAQLGPTDMRLPIAYALSHPQRWPLAQGERAGLAGLGPIKLPAINSGNLSFENPDFEAFPALKLAYAAGREGGTAPAVLSGANEAAVALFLADEIRFADIVPLVEKTLNASSFRAIDSIETAIHAEREARRRLEELAGM